MEQNERVVIIKLRDYLMNIPTEELTERLKYLDKAIQELHDNGYYVVSDLAEIEIINNEITLDSFKDKVDYLNSGINENGRNKNILELCSIGICAYNKLSVLHTSKDFIVYVIDNVEMFLEHGNIPGVMQEYYIDVFNRGKVDYLNSFLLNYGENENTAGEISNSKVYTKSTEAGRQAAREEREREREERNNIVDINDYRNRNSNLWKPFSGVTAIGRTFSKKKEAAFASILLLPALLALIYLVAIVVYFVFIK